MVRVTGEDPQNKLPFWGYVVSGDRPTGYLISIIGQLSLPCPPQGVRGNPIGVIGLKPSEKLFFGIALSETPLCRSPKRQKANATT